MRQVFVLIRCCLIGGLAAGCVLGVAASVEARVKKIVIDAKDSVAGQGKGAKSAGPYERLAGHVYGEINTRDPHNAIINDIDLAPLNERGMVEYVATFQLSIPSDRTKLSGILLHGVPNRGTRPGLGDFPSGGHMILTSGWQGDIAPRAGVESISVPVARNKDGSSVTGRVLARLKGAGLGTVTVSLPSKFAPASLNTVNASLLRRIGDDGAVFPVAPSDWAFSDCRTVPFPGTPDATRISLRDGFDSSYLYDLAYDAKDPPILGIGYAATRDLVSFLRYADKDDMGTANPTGKKVTHVISRGDSQAGNFIRSFIHLGFNEDESGHIVWDGANPYIAARQQPINFRFAVPGGAASLYEPGSEGTLWWDDYEDKARGRQAVGLLTRSKKSGTSPKIFETFGSAEFWGLRMSPNLVGTSADQDVPLPPNVRRYYFPGTTHGGGSGGFNHAGQTGFGGKAGGGLMLVPNPNSQRETMRALMAAFVDWVVKDKAPPPSEYPTLAAGQLVTPNRVAMGFPAIPGVPFPDNLINPFYDYDFGPQFRNSDLSGVHTIQPPVIRRVLPSLVPKVDSDGNEVGGVPSVLHLAPLGTYVGWNAAKSGPAKGRNTGFAGGYIPFARTKASRLAAGDPRRSLEERYGDHAGYVAAASAAAKRLVQKQFLLVEDAERLIREAEASDVLR